MFILGNFVHAVASILSVLIDILSLLVIIRAILSWVNPDPYNQVVQFIEKSTEWILAPLRKLLPTFKIGIDISPILALLFLYFLKIFVIQTLFEIAIRLR